MIPKGVWVVFVYSWRPLDGCVSHREGPQIYPKFAPRHRARIVTRAPSYWEYRTRCVNWSCCRNQFRLLRGCPMLLVSQKGHKFCVHNHVFGVLYSNVSFMHSQWCDCHVYTCSTGAQVAATVHAASECGQFVAIKCIINGQVVHHSLAPARTSSHHQELPASNQTPLGKYQQMSRHPPITSKDPRTARDPCRRHKEVPKASRRHQALRHGCFMQGAKCPTMCEAQGNGRGG